MNFLALGDSYTIGEAVSESERWPVLLMKAFQEKGWDFGIPEIIATTGWRTDELKNAITKANLHTNYKLVSLLIGVNNQYQGQPVEGYANEFKNLLTIAIEHANGNSSNVFVVSIPDYGYTPFGEEKKEQISKAIDEFNLANKTISEKYNVRYINITDISRKGLSDPELIAHDGLHPSGKMYRLWVDRMLEGL